jgi:pimeloyl-ACP methyl ester carboxylesterase
MRLRPKSLALKSVLSTLSWFCVVHGQVAPSGEGRYFDSAGTKIHYVERGQGEPVILIHGFGANLNVNWAGMMGPLAKEYRVVAVDNRGHGRSDRPTAPGSYGRCMVEDVVRLMDHLEIPRAHIVGYSMGAFIAGKFLSEHPDRVVTATLGGAGWVEMDGEWESLLDEIVASLESGGGVMPLLRFLNSRRQPRPSEEQLRTINTLLIAMNNPKVLAQVARQLPELAVSKESLARNERRVLGIVGELDPFRESVEALGELLPNAKIVVVAGGDHVTTIRTPEFLREIKHFLDENRESRLDEPSPAAASLEP